MAAPAPIHFTACLWRYSGAGGWTFVTVPPEHELPVTGPFGRTPVRATIDGMTWTTSVWRDTKLGVLLAVPKRVRGAKQTGDFVDVEIAFDPTRW